MNIQVLLMKSEFVINFDCFFRLFINKVCFLKNNSHTMVQLKNNGVKNIINTMF